MTDAPFTPQTPGAIPSPGARPPASPPLHADGRAIAAFMVYGTPGPQGSKRHVGKGVMIESSKKVKPWREAVKQAALDLIITQPWTPLDGPLVAEFCFTFKRPKGHYRTGRNAHLLHNGAPPYPAVVPDLSKLIRSTEDALTDAGVWADDARVVAYHQPRKVYAGSRDEYALHAPGAVIRIWEATA